MKKMFNKTITDYIAVLSKNPKTGYSLEFNRVVWNTGGPENFDIRNWSPDHEKAGKGITLTLEEAEKLKSVLNEILV